MTAMWPQPKCILLLKINILKGVHLENGKYPTLRAFFKQPVQRSEIESLYDVYESHILGKVHENPVVVVREPHSFFRIAYIQVSSYFL